MADLKTVDERANSAETSANEYVITMENIKDAVGQTQQTTMGDLVSQSVQIQHAEMNMQVGTSIPQGVQKNTNKAGSELAQTAKQ